jgi:hypothetical protein
MATQAGPKQQAEGLRKSYISTKPSPKGGYNGCGFFTISRASILVQKSPLVMPGSPFSSWLLRSSCWATFSRQSQLIRVASNRSGEYSKSCSYASQDWTSAKVVSKLWLSRESLAYQWLILLNKNAYCTSSFLDSINSVYRKESVQSSKKE